MKINLADTKKNGRPKKNEDKKTAHIKVYLSPAVREAFANFCESKSTNCSSYLGNIIADILSGGGLDERKD